MSTLTISPALVPARRPARPARPAPGSRVAVAAAPVPVRLTRRGRVLVLLVALVAVLAAMVAFGGLATATLTGGTPEQVRIVEVQPGDTLYGIAGEVAGPGKVRDMVHHIEQLNSLPSASLQVGQKIAVPAP